MITHLSHVCVYVLNQESAEDFYVNKLGFQVHTDAPMGPGIRWLTVHPKGKPDLEITLIEIKEGMRFDQDSAEKMKSLMKKGVFGFGVFSCDDFYATIEELKAKGVKFRKEPKREFYGIEAIFLDVSGNWYSLTQPA